MNSKNLLQDPSFLHELQNLHLKVLAERIAKCAMPPITNVYMNEDLNSEMERLFGMPVYEEHKELLQRGRNESNSSPSTKEEIIFTVTEEMKKEQKRNKLKEEEKQRKKQKKKEKKEREKLSRFMNEHSSMSITHSLSNKNNASITNASNTHCIPASFVTESSDDSGTPVNNAHKILLHKAGATDKFNYSNTLNRCSDLANNRETAFFSNSATPLKIQYTYENIVIDKCRYLSDVRISVTFSDITATIEMNCLHETVAADEFKYRNDLHRCSKLVNCTATVFSSKTANTLKIKHLYENIVIDKCKQLSDLHVFVTLSDTTAFVKINRFPEAAATDESAHPSRLPQYSKLPVFAKAAVYSDTARAVHFNPHHKVNERSLPSSSMLYSLAVKKQPVVCKTVEEKEPEYVNLASLLDETFSGRRCFVSLGDNQHMASPVSENAPCKCYDHKRIH